MSRGPAPSQAEYVFETACGGGCSSAHALCVVSRWWAACKDTGCRVKYLIRDRDGKYPALFDTILADTGIKTVLTGVRMPA